MTAADEARAAYALRRSDDPDVMAEQQDAEDEVYQRIRAQEQAKVELQAQIVRNRRGTRITVADFGP